MELFNRGRIFVIAVVAVLVTGSLTVAYSPGKNCEIYSREAWKFDSLPLYVGIKPFKDQWTFRVEANYHPDRTSDFLLNVASGGSFQAKISLGSLNDKTETLDWTKNLFPSKFWSYIYLYEDNNMLFVSQRNSLAPMSFDHHLHPNNKLHELLIFTDGAYLQLNCHDDCDVGTLPGKSGELPITNQTPIRIQAVKPPASICQANGKCHNISYSEWSDVPQSFTDIDVNFTKVKYEGLFMAQNSCDLNNQDNLTSEPLSPSTEYHVDTTTYGSSAFQAIITTLISVPDFVTGNTYSYDTAPIDEDTSFALESDTLHTSGNAGQSSSLGSEATSKLSETQTRPTVPSTSAATWKPSEPQTRPTVPSTTPHYLPSTPKDGKRGETAEKSNNSSTAATICIIVAVIVLGVFGVSVYRRGYHRDVLNILQRSTTGVTDENPGPVLAVDIHKHRNSTITEYTV